MRNDHSSHSGTAFDKDVVKFNLVNMKFDAGASGNSALKEACSYLAAEVVGRCTDVKSFANYAMKSSTACL